MRVIIQSVVSVLWQFSFSSHGVLQRIRKYFHSCHILFGRNWIFVWNRKITRTSEKRESYRERERERVNEALILMKFIFYLETTIFSSFNSLLIVMQCVKYLKWNESIFIMLFVITFIMVYLYCLSHNIISYIWHKRVLFTHMRIFTYENSEYMLLKTRNKYILLIQFQSHVQRLVQVFFSNWKGYFYSLSVEKEVDSTCNHANQRAANSFINFIRT